MPLKETNIFDQLHIMGTLIPTLDSSYSRLTHFLKKMTPILKKKIFDREDQAALREFCHGVHQELDEFHQLLRRGNGEAELLRDEIRRLKSQAIHSPSDYAVAEAELMALEDNLVIREKALKHLNELVQLLDSVIHTGEITDFDEKLLTDIVLDLKNPTEE